MTSFHVPLKSMCAYLRQKCISYFTNTCMNRSSCSHGPIYIFTSVYTLGLFCFWIIYFLAPLLVDHMWAMLSHSVLAISMNIHGWIGWRKPSTCDKSPKNVSTETVYNKRWWKSKLQIVPCYTNSLNLRYYHQSFTDWKSSLIYKIPGHGCYFFFCYMYFYYVLT